MIEKDTRYAERLWVAMGTSQTFRHRLAWEWLALSLARQIHEIRTSKGWTQQELATRSDLAVATIIRYERSCRHASLHNLCRIAGAFDCALLCSFTSFRRLVILMADDVIVVPPSFDEEQALVAAGAHPLADFAVDPVDRT